MIGCDCKWSSEDDAVGSPGPAPSPAAGAPLLPQAAAGDYAVPASANPHPPSATIDPHDFMKWDLTGLPSIPVGEQQFDKVNITSRRSWHAALLLEVV